MKKYNKGICWGVWDYCHEGHLNLLKNASKKCKQLIVGVSKDEYVVLKKGVKPRFDYNHRNRLIESLKFVEKTYPQSKKYNKKWLIEKEKADVIFVGDDWKNKNWDGEKLGLPVEYLKYTKGISSTQLRGNPLVSIVIPVWGDYKKYLPECLESIKAQTYKNYEIIIVENKTDLPSARNEGIKKAKGKYILLLDVDDLLDPRYLEKTIKKGGDIITTAHLLNGEKKILAECVTLDEIRRHNVVIACSLFKKEVWEKIKGYDETLNRGLEDWDFWIRAMEEGYKIEVIDEPLYIYRKRADGMISSMKNKTEVIKYILNKNIKYSVIIPTMWASDKIKKMINVYDNSPFISEVLIINNRPEDEIKLKSNKIKEIYRGENIFVNPAWNLGAEKAKEDNIIIANDDIYFDNLDELLMNIWLKDKMVIGPSQNCYKKKGYDNGDLRIEATDYMGWGFGTFMIMKKNSFKKIPEHLLIWEGDVTQFQANDAYHIKGVKIDTEMSETIKKFNLNGKAQLDLGNKSMLKRKNNKDITDKITFIIKTFKRYNCLNNLLFSIKKYYPNNKIIIADDNNAFNNRFYIKWKKVLDLEVIRLPYDKGVSYGRNRMVEKVKTPYTLLLDDDFIFTEETKIEKFYKVIDSNKKIGVVGGLCLVNNKEQHYEFLMDFKDGILIENNDGDNYEDINGVKAKKTDVVLNFGLFRTELFKDVKWDDELKIAEHLDFYIKLKKTDWEVYYTPEVKIIHDKILVPEYKEFRLRSSEYQLKMFKKNKIKKLIKINGTVCELKNNNILKYKIFRNTSNVIEINGKNNFEFTNLNEVTFCITMFDRWEKLKNLLYSITKYYPFANILITDQSKKFIAKEYRTLYQELFDLGLKNKPTAINMPFDCGLSACRNKLVGLTRTKYVLILEEDFEFTEKTSISEMLNILEDNIEISGVGGQVEENGIKLDFSFYYKKKGKVLEMLKNNNKYNKKGYRDTEGILNFALFRRSIFNKVLWDQNIKVSGEHTDFLFKLKEADLKIVETIKSTIKHNKERDSGEYRAMRLRDEFLVTLFNKYKINKLIYTNGFTILLKDGIIVKGRGI
jgi:glycerol-3-phosphate cytidylyltransferase